MTRMSIHRPGGAVRAGVLAGACALALAACGSSAGLASGQSKAGAMSAMRMKKGSTMSGMNMKQMSGTVDGIKPVPTQELASAQWQHMEITARAMTAVPFVIYNGHNERMVKPTKHTSFHLMVMLDDARSGVPIPYASVWATISRAGKVVYDERQWPMLSEYMGPHYGNDVSLPGAGHYTLSLLISPPVSARHLEYQHIWLKAHRVTLPFTWKGSTT
jgi:uncharacterized protein involved in high-affinity Fe2+ transport